jgi:hypothetical protein
MEHKRRDRCVHVFDAIGKFANPAQVVEAFARTGWPLELAVPIGTTLLILHVALSDPVDVSRLGSVLPVLR